MFNFNEEDKGSKNVPIFNNGDAGVAKGITVTALKKGVDYEDGMQVPDYKIRYQDASGKIEDGFYYQIKEGFSSQYGTYDDAVKKQWKKVGSILEAAGVDSAGAFTDATDMLDKLMSKINYATEGKTFNVFGNYGHVNNPKKYLQIRSWTPFIEAEDANPTVLKQTSIDQMERLVPDSGTNTNSTGWGA